MATQGMVVFCNIYSTFTKVWPGDSRRSHTKLTRFFCLDRAGLVGEDGGTHHGVFDLAYLRCIPNMIIYLLKRNRTTEYTLHRSTWLRSPNSHPLVVVAFYRIGKLRILATMKNWNRSCTLLKTRNWNCRFIEWTYRQKRYFGLSQFK
jgi:hypothetical protein